GYYYDVLRALEYLRRAGVPRDERMTEAIDLVVQKRGQDGLWCLENPHPEQLDLGMDEAEGKPSRWNTLRALRVLDWYSADTFSDVPQSGMHGFAARLQIPSD